MSLFSMPIVVLFCLLGMLAGFLAGLLGIGGGVVLVPLFLWGFTVADFSPEILVHTAFGTSLAIIVPTAISSTFGHRKRGNVAWHQVFHLSIGAMLGALGGSSLAALMSGESLRSVFGLMQILVGLKLFLFHPRLPPERQDAPPIPALLGVGLAGGIFSAFFGVGGGVIAVPLMVIALSLPIHLAVGNSSALIVISAFFATLSYIFHGLHRPDLPPFSLGYVNFAVAGLVAPLSMIFARLGARLASRTPHDKLVRVFALLLMGIGARLILQTLWG